MHIATYNIQHKHAAHDTERITVYDLRFTVCGLGVQKGMVWGLYTVILGGSSFLCTGINYYLRGASRRNNTVQAQYPWIAG